MPLRLEIKRLLTARSDRVKCVDLHPTEPWILVALYSGDVHIWNYEQSEIVKSFEITELPVRCCRFIPRKQWIVVGSDDMLIRIYNYNTMEKVHTIEAHNDYIRSIAVHPTLPLFLSSSDDMSVKMWDWEKNWKCVQVFDGHTHYVMAVCFNPKDPNTFASASLDRTIKVWNLSSPTPNFTLEGHEKGVNCLDYFTGGDKPHLVSGADDKTIKIWDYQNRTCIQTLEGHTYNVSVVGFHPELPIIISGSEDGTVRFWHSSTYRLEDTLKYGMERIWAMSTLRGQKTLCLGYDEGMIMLKLGQDQPRVSMDNAGKVMLAKHNEIQTINLKLQSQQIEGEGTAVVDGEKLVVVPKDLGSCEVYPQRLEHSPSGRFVLVCGDGEYIIYTALAWRNKSFGKALDVVWGAEGNDYAVAVDSSNIRLFRNFKEYSKLSVTGCRKIFGGTLITLTTKDAMYLYDWDLGKSVRQIDVIPSIVSWSDGGDLLFIATSASFYILRYHRDVVKEWFDKNDTAPAGGVEGSLEVIHEVADVVQTAKWVGDVLIYTNSHHRLNYCVGKDVFTIAHMDRALFVLGYLSQMNRLFLVDREFNIVSYSVPIAMLEYQTHIVRGDVDAAEQLLPSISDSQRNQLGRFLEGLGMYDLALSVAVDAEQRFDLAAQLGRLDVAHDIAKEADADGKWRQLAVLATDHCRFDLALECHERARDWSAMLLIGSCLADAAAMLRVAEGAQEDGLNNVAFVAYFLTGHLDECMTLLKDTDRIPEAAFFARTYLPSQVSDMLNLWRVDLAKINAKAAAALADPAEYSNLFPDIALAMRAEAHFAAARDVAVPANEYSEAEDPMSVDALALIKALIEKEEKEKEVKEEEVKEEEKVVVEEKEEEKEEEKVVVEEEKEEEEEVDDIPDMDSEENRD